MNKSMPLYRKLGRFTLAAAMIGATAASMVSAEGTAGLNREDAIRLSRPLNNQGDPEIRNMPVIAGHNYRG